MWGISCTCTRLRLRLRQRLQRRLRLRLRLRLRVLRVITSDILHATTSGIWAVRTNGGLPGEVCSGGLARCEELTLGRARIRGRALVGMAAIGAAMALA